MPIPLKDLKQLLLTIENDLGTTCAEIRDSCTRFTSLAETHKAICDVLKNLDAQSGPYRTTNDSLRYCVCFLLQRTVAIEISFTLSYFQHIAGWNHTVSLFPPMQLPGVFKASASGGAAVNISPYLESDACRSLAKDSIGISQPLTVVSMYGSENPVLWILLDPYIRDGSILFEQTQGPRLCDYKGTLDPFDLQFPVRQWFSGAVGEVLKKLTGQPMSLANLTGTGISLEAYGCIVGPNISLCAQLSNAKRSDRRPVPFVKLAEPSDFGIRIDKQALEVLFTSALEDAKQYLADLQKIEFRSLAFTPDTSDLSLTAWIMCHRTEPFGIGTLNVTVRAIIKMRIALHADRNAVVAWIRVREFVGEPEIDVDVGALGLIPGVKAAIRGIVRGMLARVIGMAWSRIVTKIGLAASLEEPEVERDGIILYGRGKR